MNSPYGFAAGVGAVKREPYDGRRFAIYMMIFPGTWILVDISEEAA